MYKWSVKNPHLDPMNVVEDIYKARGIADYRALFNLSEDDMHDPYLLHDMEKTVKRIMRAIKDKERILIYGDYDVDGITSTYILYHTILELGGLVDFDIPNRFLDGYGLSTSKVFDIINDEFKLVITVDNGIKSIEEAKLFKDNGVDFIVTDHHEPEPKLPDAYTIIHTALNDYPFKPLAGVGVSFKLVQALIGDLAFQYLDIVALGTIADMMPLIDENRAIVNVGLKQLIQSKNVGLSKLIETQGLIRPSVSDVQFKLAPRINACGRMKSAKIALDLLLSTTPLDAIRKVAEIEDINSRRKKLTKQLYEESSMNVDNTKPSIFIHSPKMHEGVIGIIASRLANEYNKVAVVLKEDDFTFKGSIRSYNGVDVITILSELKEVLIRFGGHQNAAGLEFKKEDLELFKTRFNELIPKAKTNPTINAEGVLDIYKLPISQIEDLDQYDLKDCMFVFDNIFIKNKYLIRGEHTKLIISNDSEAIFFNNVNLYKKITKSSNIALLGRLDINSFQSKTTKQIIIDDYQINN